MHVFGIVLEDGNAGFFEDQHPRYLFLYEDLLSKTAKELNVTPIKDLDGFAEAEKIANTVAESADTIEWLSAYNDARDEIEPIWFEPEGAYHSVTAVKESIKEGLKSNPDEDVEYLVESLEVLSEILDEARGRDCRFFMALM